MFIAPSQHSRLRQKSHLGRYPRRSGKSSLAIRSPRPTTQSSETGIQVIVSSIPGDFNSHAQGPSSQIEKAHRVLQDTGAMAATNPFEGQNSPETLSKRSGSDPAEAEENSREGSASGKSPTLRETESSETVVRSPSSKPACKGPKSSQKGGSKGSQGVLLRSLKQDESTNNAETLKTEEVAASCVHPNVEASKTAQALSPRARGHSQSVPRITIKPATDATGIISPLPTPSGTREPSLSGEEIRGSTMSRRNSMTQDPFRPATGMTSGFFLDTTKPTPSQPTRSVDELSSLLQFPEYGHDAKGTGGANPPAEVVSRKKRRSHVLRKGRYLVFRSPVLQAMLGREIAGQAKLTLHRHRIQRLRARRHENPMPFNADSRHPRFHPVS